jgi:hypothetical protein
VPIFNNFSSLLNGQPGVQNINSQFSLPGPQSMAAANATTSVNTGVTALMPSLLHALRSDPQIAAQAERMVDGVSAQCAGNDYSVSLKPGLLRRGGEQVPRVKTAWPHDYVFNFGKKSGINYEDLDQTQLLSLCSLTYKTSCKMPSSVSSRRPNTFTVLYYPSWRGGATHGLTP